MLPFFQKPKSCQISKPQNGLRAAACGASARSAGFLKGFNVFWARSRTILAHSFPQLEKWFPPIFQKFSAYFRMIPGISDSFWHVASPILIRRFVAKKWRKKHYETARLSLYDVYLVFGTSNLQFWLDINSENCIRISQWSICVQREWIFKRVLMIFEPGFARF